MAYIPLSSLSSLSSIYRTYPLKNHIHSVSIQFWWTKIRPLPWVFFPPIFTTKISQWSFPSRRTHNSGSFFSSARRSSRKTKRITSVCLWRLVIMWLSWKMPRKSELNTRKHMMYSIINPNISEYIRITYSDMHVRCSMWSENMLWICFKPVQRSWSEMCNSFKSRHCSICLICLIFLSPVFLTRQWNIKFRFQNRTHASPKANISPGQGKSN